MIISTLSDYINAHAPMTNLPELLNLHHGNPLGLHPIVIPILLLLLAVGLHTVTHYAFHKDRRDLYPLLYTLVGIGVVATYYYCFSGDLPLFEDQSLHHSEICIGWFCQGQIVGLGWSLLGVALLTYTVFFLLDGLMQVLAQLSDSTGMEENAWREWGWIVLAGLIGAAVTGVADDFSPITGVWLMIACQLIVFVMTAIKLGADTVRTKKFGRCLPTAVCFLVGFEAVMMLAIECIEGFIYIFIPVLGVLTAVDFRYKKKHN